VTVPDAVPAFEQGVRLRREPDGSAMLLVPEGVVRLNGSAAAALDLVDGRRTLDDIAACLADGPFDASRDRIAEDVQTLFTRLRERHLVRW
jgi:pyrroloquinoline quinone biosynthesis protein D